MSLSRRNFVRTLGVGGAGMLSTSFIIGRGREAMAFETEAAHPPDDGGIIRISSNENARGPGPKVIAALHNTISPRAGRGYPPDHTNELVDTIAELYGVERDSVIIGTGSGGILEAGVLAFSRRRSRSHHQHAAGVLSSRQQGPRPDACLQRLLQRHPDCRLPGGRESADARRRPLRDGFRRSGASHRPRHSRDPPLQPAEPDGQRLVARGYDAAGGDLHAASRRGALRRDSL